MRRQSTPVSFICNFFKADGIEIPFGTAALDVHSVLKIFSSSARSTAKTTRNLKILRSLKKLCRSVRKKLVLFTRKVAYVFVRILSCAKTCLKWTLWNQQILRPCCSYDC